MNDGPLGARFEIGDTVTTMTGPLTPLDVTTRRLADGPDIPVGSTGRLRAALPPLGGDGGRWWLLEVADPTGGAEPLLVPVTELMLKLAP